MARSDIGGSHPKSWETLYRMAILEPHPWLMSERLSAAEAAVVERARELFGKSGADVDEEREALDDALYALRAMKVAVEQNTHAV